MAMGHPERRSANLYPRTRALLTRQEIQIHSSHFASRRLVPVGRGKRGQEERSGL